MTRAPALAMAAPSAKTVPKVPTGIAGFDEITGGGIPRNRTTAVYGATGVGKTVFALQCLVHAAKNGEPGVFLSFGESTKETHENAKSLGLDLAGLAASGHLVLDSAIVEPEEITPTGGYTLDGVFVRLEQSIELVGAKLVVVDALNVLAQTIPGPATVRADLRRLLNGLKRRGLTIIVTIEDSEVSAFRPEEFLADCVIHLGHPVAKGIATRTLRVVKYRGSPHRPNEYPFLISDHGVALSVTTAEVLGHPSSTERISMGIAGLDAMLGGGVYRGDTIFVTGSAGAGKTSFTAAIAMAACARGERCLFVALEEPPSQIVRNMNAIGLDLQGGMQSGLLSIQSPKPDLEGLEGHLAFVLEQVEAFRPHVVVLDPLTPLMALGHADDVRETIIRLLSLIKARGITAACTLLARERYLEEQNTPFASFVDDIVLLTNLEQGGARSRSLSVLKARGIGHSTEVRDFRFTPQGVVVDTVRSNGKPRGAGAEDDA